MKQPNILLVSTLNPTSPSLDPKNMLLNQQQPTLYTETFESIRGLKWDGKMDMLLLREDKIKEGGYKNNLRKMQDARNVLLAGPYDYMFTVEADMIIPQMALERLVKVNADVAYGFYCSRHASRRWLLFDETGNEVTDEYRNRVLSQWGKVVPSWGMGFGCTLIKRHVLEKIDFRRVERGAAADAYFAEDVRVAGLVQKHDLGVLCGHIIQPYPLQVVYPDNKPPYYKIWQRKRRFEVAEATAALYTVLKPITTPDRGFVKRGEEILLSVEQAAALLSIGVVEPVEGEYPETSENPPIENTISVQED